MLVYMPHCLVSLYALLMLVVIIPVEDNATTGGVREDDDKTALTWIFYIVGM